MDDKPRCHWCDGLIDDYRGYWKLEARGPLKSYGPEPDEVTYACWLCGVHEINNKVSW